jgi:hypothetical protein
MISEAVAATLRHPAYAGAQGIDYECHRFDRRRQFAPIG